MDDQRAAHYKLGRAGELTPRQREVMDLIAAGRTNGEIAQELGLTLDGVKWHVREILARFNVASREEAAEAWRTRPPLTVRARRRFAAFPALLLARPLAWAGVAAGAAGVVVLVAAFAVAIPRGGGTAGADDSVQAAQCELDDVHVLVTAVADQDAIVMTAELWYREVHTYPWEYIGIAHETRCRLAGDFEVRILESPLTPERDPVPLEAAFAPPPAVAALDRVIERDRDQSLFVRFEWRNFCGKAVETPAADIRLKLAPPADQQVGWVYYAPLPATPPCTDRGAPSALAVVP
ncbi:MAG: helix-turn-helix transcriptional regulator [Dehalococcoidia bacterium]|nr:helix-turn-helix transcriptional regulator [Dehalococcoidia bacterium]